MFIQTWSEVGADWKMGQDLWSEDGAQHIQSRTVFTPHHFVYSNKHSIQCIASFDLHIDSADKQYTIKLQCRF